jgi:hypothetical protein
MYTPGSSVRRPPRPEPVPECVPGQARSQRLLARDHVKLLFQDPEERIPVESRRCRHADIMPTASDKQSVS